MSRFGRSRPTKAAIIPHAAGLTFFGLAVLTENRWLLLLAGAAFGLVLAAILLRPRVDGLTFGVDGPTRTRVGEQVSFVIRIRNGSVRATTAAHVTHQIAGLGDVVVAVPPLAPGESAMAETQHTATRRMVSIEQTLHARSSTPFGLQQATALVTVTHSLVVHPLAVPPVAIRVTGRSGGDAGPSLVSRSGVDVHGIRDFRTGDTPRDVHWRSTARRGRLVVLEREEQRRQAVVFVMLGSGVEADWEPLVARTASTAATLVRGGIEVVVLSACQRQPRVIGFQGTTTVKLLDWFAAICGPQNPDREHIDSAFGYAGDGATAVAAMTAAVPSRVWESLCERAAVAGVRLLRLGTESS